MNSFTQTIIAAALKVIEFAATPSVNPTLALALTTIAGKLVDYAIAFDPAPDSTALLQSLKNKVAAAGQDVDTRTADLGGALNKVSK